MRTFLIEVIKLEPVEKLQYNDESDHLNDLSDRELEDLINQKLTSKFLYLTTTNFYKIVT
jgi:hypothetical protein